jgi:carbon monoxide dehydrogenase subunit G
VELTNDFRVDVPIEQAWQVLTDVERIAPCMPGAQLTGVEGDGYLGTVKVKVGPITAQYKGKAVFQEKDDTAHRAVIKAEGRETRGQGNANAVITAVLREDGGGTAVSVSTDLTITGKAAQFGRGVLADVSSKLLQQFVKCLEADVLSSNQPATAEQTADADADASSAPQAAATAPEPAGPVEAAAAAATAVAPAVGGPTEAPAAPTTSTPAAPAQAASPARPSAPAAPAAAAEAAPINLIGTVAGPVAKRAAPFALVLLLGILIGRRLR